VRKAFLWPAGAAPGSGDRWEWPDWQWLLSGGTPPLDPDPDSAAHVMIVAWEIPPLFEGDEPATIVERVVALRQDSGTDPPEE
jgi:hypothetical protein